MPETVTQAKGDSEMTMTEQPSPEFEQIVRKMDADNKRAGLTMTLSAVGEDGKVKSVTLGNGAPPLGTSRTPRLATGIGLPGERYPVPMRANVEFYPAPDIEQIARALISRHETKFGNLREVRIEYRWKAVGGKTGGKLTFGKCVRVSGLNAELSKRKEGDAPVSFVIWLAADNVDAMQMTRLQVEALVYHELCHAYVDEDGKATIHPHDFQAFKSEVVLYGDWHSDLQAARDAFSQLPLWQG